ncbi:dihydropyrimidinase, partial [Pseudomonas aeruginosa]|nr:dihydropyrimidinase [Pseudomonas aeruginosa]
FFRHAPRTFVILSALTGFESRC